jgi:choline dehydrogenase-like flavoprotein
MEECDLLVLGSGTGGKILAGTFAQKGQRVIVIERKYVQPRCAGRAPRGRWQTRTGAQCGLINAVAVRLAVSRLRNGVCESKSLLVLLVAGEGFEPSTSGL